jgi:mitogen-activated protein kinase kinase
MASSNGSSSKLKGRNIKNLSLPSPKLASKPASSAADAQVPGSRASHNLSSRRVSNSHNVDETIRPDSMVGDLTEQMATLELGVEFKLDLRPEDLKTVERLGAGNGGTVSKVMHIPTKTIMAKKVSFSRVLRGLIAGDSCGEETGCKKTDFARAADYA